MGEINLIYIKVKWLHVFNDEPVWLYSELDKNRHEIRKVEVFPDGSLGYANTHLHTKSTKLGKVSVPQIEEIAQDPEFESYSTSKKEFEDIWEKAISRKLLNLL